MHRYRITNKKTGKQTTHKMPVDVAVRIIAFGNKPSNYIVEKLFDNGVWKVVPLEGKEIYQVERELEEA